MSSTPFAGRRPLPWALALLMGASALVALGQPARAVPAPSAPTASSVATAAVGAPAGRSDRVKKSRGRHTWTTTEQMVPVVTGPDDDIEIELDTTLYVPDNASRKTPQPAILMTHGFGLTKNGTEILTTARFFAAHGYVVLTFTSSGFGASGGCVTLQSADHDVKSASQLIDALLEPRADVLRTRRGVVVGTIGGSYGGGIQLPLAAHDKRIRASVVGRTWNNLIYSLDPNNRVVPGDRTGLTHELNDQGVFKQEWTSLFYALGNAQPAQGNGGCPEAKQASGDAEEIAAAAACPGYYLGLCRTASRLVATGTYDAESRRLITRASASRFLHRVNIPVLLVQGQSDTLFNVNDASSTYRTLDRRNVPVAMIWNSGGHGGYTSQPGECEAYDGKDRSVEVLDDCYLSLRSLGWMEHWLRDKPRGRGPAFTYYRDWSAYAGSGANDEQYGKAGRFPLRRTTRFTLSGSTSLTAPGVEPEAGSARFINPPGGTPAAYTEKSNFTGPDASPSTQNIPPREIDGQFAAFTSEPFAKPFTSVGIPTGRIRITNSNGQDMVFFGKLYDVDPSGSATLIHRLISPVRVPADAVGAPVRFRLAGFAHRFKAGHRVRLVLASTDLTSYNAKVADVLTVETGRGSVLVLPGRLRGR